MVERNTPGTAERTAAVDGRDPAAGAVEGFLDALDAVDRIRRDFPGGLPNQDLRASDEPLCSEWRPSGRPPGREARFPSRRALLDHARVGMKTYEMQAEAPLADVKPAMYATLYDEAEQVFETSSPLSDRDGIMYHGSLRTFALQEWRGWTVVIGPYYGEWSRESGGPLSHWARTKVLTGWYNENTLMRGWEAHQNGELVARDSWWDSCGPSTEESWPDHGFARWGRAYTHTPLWLPLDKAGWTVLIAAKDDDYPEYLDDF